MVGTESAAAIADGFRGDLGVGMLHASLQLVQANCLPAYSSLDLNSFPHFGQLKTIIGWPPPSDSAWWAELP